MIDIIESTCKNFFSYTKYSDEIKFNLVKDNTVTVCCDNLILFRVTDLKSKYNISSRIEILLNDNNLIAFRGFKNKFFEYSITEKEKIGKALYIIIEQIFSCADNYISENYNAERFDCCSRYIECSNKRECIHPEILHSTGCTYRKHLASGRIFYGKNKNI